MKKNIEIRNFKNMDKNTEREIYEIRNLNGYMDVYGFVDVIEDTMKVRHDLIELYRKMKYIEFDKEEQKKLDMMLYYTKDDFDDLHEIVKKIKNRIKKEM